MQEGVILSNLINKTIYGGLAVDVLRDANF